MFKLCERKKEITNKKEIIKHLIHCEKTCNKYYSCDTIAFFDDILKEIEEEEGRK